MSSINITGKVYNLRAMDFTRGGENLAGAEFSLARRTGRKHKDGERKGQSVVEFYQVKVFNPQRAKAILENVSEQDYLSVDGEPILTKYPAKRKVRADGKLMEITIPDFTGFEVHLERFDFCADAEVRTMRDGEVLEAEVVDDDGVDVTGDPGSAPVTDGQPPF